MADNEMTLAELWSLVQKSNRDTRDDIIRELEGVRKRLDSFVTHDQWAAEKKLLEMRLARAEQELEELERVQVELDRRIREEKEAELARKEQERLRLEAEERARLERHRERKLNLWYKAVIPILAIILPILAALWSPMGK